MECPDLWEIENSLFAQGCGCLCGVDEAGAGPLAGRVYAGAVILPRGWGHPYLNDSKQVTERRREILYDRICQEAVAWSVAWAEVEEIDRINILRARLLAMERAIQGLSRRPDLALVDGNRSEGITVPCRTSFFFPTHESKRRHHNNQQIWTDIGKCQSSKNGCL